MRQAGRPSRTRRKRCLHCGALFEPDRRSQGKQQYCSASECQKERQRANERSWRERNPGCLEYQQKRTREWHRARPGYSGERRAKDPELARRNREFTRERMRRRRREKVFDKSKSIITQLIGNRGGYCYLSRGGTWFLARLTKASPCTKPGSVVDNRRRFKRVDNLQARLPGGRLYCLVGAPG